MSQSSLSCSMDPYEFISDSPDRHPPPPLRLVSDKNSYQMFERANIAEVRCRYSFLTPPQIKAKVKEMWIRSEERRRDSPGMGRGREVVKSEPKKKVEQRRAKKDLFSAKKDPFLVKKDLFLKKSDPFLAKKDQMDKENEESNQKKQREAEKSPKKKEQMKEIEQKLVVRYEIDPDETEPESDHSELENQAEEDKKNHPVVKKVVFQLEKDPKKVQSKEKPQDKTSQVKDYQKKQPKEEPKKDQKRKPSPLNPKLFQNQAMVSGSKRRRQMKRFLKPLEVVTDDEISGRDASGEELEKEPIEVEIKTLDVVQKKRRRVWASQPIQALVYCDVQNKIGDRLRTLQLSDGDE